MMIITTTTTEMSGIVINCRISEDEDGDTANGESVYRIKYERAARELEFTKRRLQTQHEHDLEQLVGLKKQLEKKVRVMRNCSDVMAPNTLYWPI